MGRVINFKGNEQKSEKMQHTHTHTETHKRTNP